MGKRTAAAYRIQQNAKGIVEDTAGERALEVLCAEIDIGLVKPQMIAVRDVDGALYGLRPDRKILGSRIFIHVDGDYHNTARQEAKDGWKDALLNGDGWRNLHIAAELLMKKRYWPNVVETLLEFIGSDEPNHYLYA